MLAGPNSRLKMEGTTLPVRPGKVSREVRLDREHGLMCVDVDEPVVRATFIETQARNPNGIKTLVIIMTALEAGIVGALASVGDSSNYRSPFLLVPVGADLAWGVFRSITIHREIIQGTVVTADGPEHTRVVTMKTPCPPATEIALASDGATFVARIGTGGRLEELELPALVAFLLAHPSVDLARGGVRIGVEVKFDAVAAADIVAAARRRQEEARAQAAVEAARLADEQRRAAAAAASAAPAATPPVIPGYGARAVIRWDGRGLPQVHGVIVDFPMAALCQGDAACPGGQRCGDRGDGVPLCFGPNAIHSFCGAGTDCASGLCLRRPDGVGVCR